MEPNLSVPNRGSGSAQRLVASDITKANVDQEGLAERFRKFDGSPTAAQVSLSMYVDEMMLRWR